MNDNMGPNALYFVGLGTFYTKCKLLKELLPLLVHPPSIINRYLQDIIRVRIIN